MNSSPSPLDRASGAKSVAPRLERTPHLILGPFYPIRVRSHSREVWSGKPQSLNEPSRVKISGRVLDTAGRPVRDALVEVWQADQHGRYRHADPHATQPSDPRFAGYAAQRTRASGRYFFWTLKPGAYGDGEALRAPHLHFQVTSRHYRLVTQMFFPDEPLNDRDHWYRASRRPALLVARIVQRRDVLDLSWDIVLVRAY